MGCCGEPLDDSNSGNQKNVVHNGFPMNQQPGGMAQMQYQEKQFQQPDIATPPPAHASQMGYNSNGMQMQQQQQQGWGTPVPPHSPPPTSSSPFNPYGMNQVPTPVPVSPQFTGTTAVNGSGIMNSMNGMQMNQMNRPTPLYPGASANMTATQVSGGVTNQTTTAVDEGRMSVSIDFGTTFSGVAYGSSRISQGKVQQILQWPGSFETFRKIPTCLLYDDSGRVLAWGLEAKNANLMPGASRCEWFKLFLEPRALRDGAVDPRLPSLPPGKKPIDLIIDFLSCMWEYAKEQITREIGAVADLDSADVWLTVPAAWDAKGCEIMREAAISAGLVAQFTAADKNWTDRLHIITEPEAAAVHCAHLTNLHKLRPSQNFMICDAGGGTVDLAVYKIIGELHNLEIAELCARSGANCGSLFLDLRFRELVRTLLTDHPAHLDPASLAYFMHAFSETDKLAYMGESDDNNMFHFTCFNVDDPDDPTVGLINGELSIPGNLLRREVFDPVVDQVLELLEEQLHRVDQRIDALLLVGGFSGSEYLFKRVDDQFSNRIKVIARPSDADTATCRGAAQYGLARRPLVSSVIAPRSYLMKVKLPAEQEDWQKRPAYIKQNNAGVHICENRLQYLVTKGAILRKGQRVQTKFCKFSQNPQDRLFVAILYTSDSDRIMRYTDEGETNELCKWTVDLGNLPSFQHAANSQPNGFYTEFELGLELDSCEVRGILVYEGQEWGRVVFEFLS
ncbi:actin-like ATPase domain-containing protein [Schizopora paradoxa]|uniref:Actin-like ATPase domain-containing protein n=1 Tax=Schizopora paradoxa TaxID=27342 RepID=A0A0H2RY12_9AGAM|nr:actin-like ATPase domain-containing protein [Schizopora paradoxa]